MSMYSNFNRRLPSWKNNDEDEEDKFFSSRYWDEFKRRSKRMTEETNEIWQNMDDSRRLASSSMSMMSSSMKKNRKDGDDVMKKKDDEPSWRRSQSLNRNESGLGGNYKRKIRFGDEETKPESSSKANESTNNIKDSNMEMGQIKDDDECFEVTIDVSTYTPNELKISVGSNRILIIEGKHEDERVSRTFNRKFSLPYNCLIEKIVPTLRTSKQKLVIWIPKSSEEIDMESKQVPLIVKD
ncbi:CRYAB [Lepeophtheirus salmonis]|uniref:CRYAB n=1 Tax=Lepeophtheirus salmonis TaxID=72036 RepID=A0A7R8HC28_LEPSM|nr:CRYAB [Lepeophtheirus salmonis]CAF3000034.1 CRYAB [Lepeophtheirus salmonis]